jgi:hypothetical protein
MTHGESTKFENSKRSSDARSSIEKRLHQTALRLLRSTRSSHGRAQVEAVASSNFLTWESPVVECGVFATWGRRTMIDAVQMMRTMILALAPPEHRGLPKAELRRLGYTENAADALTKASKEQSSER